MALTVELKKTTGGAVTYRLQATSFVVMVGRSPLQAPLPGGDPLLLDLGQYKTQITVSGIIGDASSTDGGVTIPSKNQLETAAYEWYDETNQIVDGSDVYVGKIASLRFEKAPDRAENQWDFSLQLVTISRA